MKKTLLASAAVLLSTSLSGAALAQPGERDLDIEEANRELVVEFYERFFNDHETEQAGEVIAEDYIQHNPDVPDGKEPFVSYFTGFFAENPDSRAEIKRSATDGDLVWLHVHSTNGDDDAGEAVVDIFRVEEGMIVEHWDVIQAVQDEAANDNTMF
ncbi:MULTISPECIES: ester cyclase [unclassified Halomonas]|uniref:nuclear transport factor 2 family protein n=1 Tax=unclassified Halomonas TaxID=2609666 RepID=UPI00209C8B98|nr:MULTISPECIES: ester cyclase [unclassified Halomonas]MCP1312911.1 ester cyclase [Halomonas sp. 707D7]MCP1325746.1 ester cyclase [Halomonas sp. 707D4]